MSDDKLYTQDRLVQNTECNESEMSEDKLWKVRVVVVGVINASHDGDSRVRPPNNTNYPGMTLEKWKLGNMELQIEHSGNFA